MGTALHLSRSEWQAVSKALEDVAHCGCAEEPAPGSVRAGLSGLYAAVTGKPRSKPMLDERQATLRRFACESFRTGKPAFDHAPALATLGFNAAQIEALGLLSL